MLSALFCISEDFIFSIIQKVKSLGDHLPIFGVLTLSFKIFVGYKSGKKSWFFLTPVICGKIYFFETEPLKHTGLASHTWNNGGNGFPILSVLNNMKLTNYFSISSKCFLSAYLEMTQIKIWTSSSLQFFFILLFLIILRKTIGTFQFWGSSFWGLIHRSCRLSISFPFWCFASSE